MEAFIKFNKGLLKEPPPVKIWLIALMSVNMVAPLFYINRFEAQVVLAAFLASFALMVALTAYSGFSPTGKATSPTGWMKRCSPTIPAGLRRLIAISQTMRSTRSCSG